MLFRIFVWEKHGAKISSIKISNSKNSKSSLDWEVPLELFPKFFGINPVEVFSPPIHWNIGKKRRSFMVGKSGKCDLEKNGEKMMKSDEI